MKTFVVKNDFIGDTTCFLQYYEEEKIIQLYNADDGEDFCCPTTTPSSVIIPDGCVCIKNYSEGEGMVDLLENLGVIERKYDVPYGNVLLTICKVQPKIYEYTE